MTHRMLFPVSSLSKFSRVDFRENALDASCHVMAATDPLPCAVLQCSLEKHSIEMCKLERCCYRWQRQAAEGRQRDKERDERER